MFNLLQEKLAVCSWSLRPTNPRDLMAQLKTIGLTRVQLALDPWREAPGIWRDLPGLCRDAGVDLVSGMFGTVGEDYSTLESIQRTGGVVPDATWPQNWENIQAVAALAGELSLPLVTLHAGFLPHDPSWHDFKKILARLAQVADLFDSLEIELGLETGQETAETLSVFLGELNRPNVGVNFDPANMILYDKGDPVSALLSLAPWLKQCHIKDAVRTRHPGAWGTEVPVGQGEVDWAAFLDALEKLRYQGNLAIEREAGEQRVQDIRAARQHLESINT